MQREFLRHHENVTEGVGLDKNEPWGEDRVNEQESERLGGKRFTFGMKGMTEIVLGVLTKIFM